MPGFDKFGPNDIITHIIGSGSPKWQLWAKNGPISPFAQGCVT